MAEAQYIWHVTIQSGHGRASYRSEIADAVLDELAPLLLADGEHSIDSVPGYTLKVTRAGKMLLATVTAGDAPICTIGVAGKSRGASRLWASLHGGPIIAMQDTGTHIADAPRAPWCAARIEAGLAEHLDSLAWLGDFERCLAWTWIERYC